MGEGSDISKTLALVLIILTVIISATSTWVLVTQSMSSEPESGFNRALVQLHILNGHAYGPIQSDTNSGDVRLYISNTKGG